LLVLNVFGCKINVKSANPWQARYVADVVSIAVKPTCVTRLAIAALNQYVGPRRIVFITGTEAKCAKLRSMVGMYAQLPVLNSELDPNRSKAHAWFQPLSL
jgi:hypothetical protein